VLFLVAMKMHRRGTAGGCNGFNDRIRAVRIETGESYRDTLPVSTFVPWATVVPVIKLFCWTPALCQSCFLSFTVVPSISAGTPVEEAEDLFKSAERTEKIAGLEYGRPKFKGDRRHEAFLSRLKARDAASSLHGEVCTDEAYPAWSYASTVSGTHSSMRLSSSPLTSWPANSSKSCSARSR